MYIGNTTESLIFCDYIDEYWEPIKSLVLGCETPILGELIKIFAGKDGGEGNPVVLSLSEISVRTVDHTGKRKESLSPSLLIAIYCAKVAVIFFKKRCSLKHECAAFHWAMVLHKCHFS